jgi:imidazolonepropionase-like amidohydrolase
MLVRLRGLDGESIDLGVAEGRFCDPDAVPIREEVDVRHLVALPGLADCHAHFSATSITDLLARPAEPDMALMRANAQRDLAAGVLLASDKGAKSDASLALLDEPPEERPRLEMAGGIVAADGGYYPGFALETTDDGLEEVVRAKAATPAQWIKLIGDWPRRGRGAVPNFSQKALSAAVAAAHSAGKRIAIHTMAPETPSQAVRAGVDSIEHGLFMTDDDVAMLGERGGAWVPTIAAVEMLVEVLGADSSGGRLLAEGLSRVRDLLAGAARRGVAVLAGTDLSVPHGAVAVEAVKMVEYGLDPADAVTALTTAAHRYLSRAEPLAPGADADAVAFAGDPREDVGLLARPVFVMRRGRILT